MEIKLDAENVAYELHKVDSRLEILQDYFELMGSEIVQLQKERSQKNFVMLAIEVENDYEKLATIIDDARTAVKQQNKLIEQAIAVCFEG